MKSTTLKSTFLVMAFFGMIFPANAQKNYQLNKYQNFSVFGTSTLHDWEMTSTAGTGTANFTIIDSELEDINEITINLLSETIKSGKVAMDRVAYKTLKTDKFKTIRYVLEKAEQVNENTWDLTGTLTIAGVSRELKTQVKTAVSDDGVSFEGTNRITFNEFGMTPPKALLGTVKTGQELMIKFNINFN